MMLIMSMFMFMVTLIMFMVMFMEKVDQDQCVDHCHHWCQGRCSQPLYRLVQDTGHLLQEVVHTHHQEVDQEAGGDQVEDHTSCHEEEVVQVVQEDLEAGDDIQEVESCQGNHASETRKYFNISASQDDFSI